MNNINTIQTITLKSENHGLLGQGERFDCGRRGHVVRRERVGACSGTPPPDGHRVRDLEGVRRQIHRGGINIGISIPFSITIVILLYSYY